MKQKVLFVRPNNFLSMNNYPSLSLILIGSTLEKAGYDVDIFTASNEDNYLDVIKTKLTKDVLFVGLTVLTTEVADAIKISKYIKQSSNVPIIWGGWHVTLFPEQTVEADFVDYAVVDEGDFSIVELAEQLIKGNTHFSDIIYSNKYFKMDDLPLPNYSLVKEIENFISRPLADKFQESISYPIRWLPYQSSRGCPGKCSFCINVVTGNQCYRTKSAEKVVDELGFLVKKYNINHFKIVDDNFFVLKNRVSKICELIIERKLRFTWDGECRVDYFRNGLIDDNLLRLLKKSGLVQLVLGVESASKKTLEYLNKEIEIDDAKMAIRALNQYGIISDCAFIVGLPGETKNDIIQTSRFINEQRKFKTFLCGVQTYRPYPKSKIAQELVREGKLREPKALEEWTKEENVSLYTYVDAYRPWIKEYKLAMNISYYHSLASGVWLFQHQIGNVFLRLINRFFIKIALLRSKYHFFYFPIDKRIYTYFRLKIYQRLEKKEKASINK